MSHLVVTARYIEEMAHEQHDGHLTMLRFNSGWKVFFGTPDLRSGLTYESLLHDIPAFLNLEDAMWYAMNNNLTIAWERPNSTKEEGLNV